MKSAAFVLLATLVACSESVPPAPPVVEPAPVVVPEPIVITIPVPPEETPAKFKVGDVVALEGAPIDAKILADEGMALWTNRNTGEEVVMRAYLIELTSPDGSETIQIRVPEIVLSAKK